MARADDDDDYDDDVDDDDRGRGATYADAGARDDDDDDDYDGASEDAMDASDDGDAYEDEDESESESEDDDYDEDVGKTKKRGKTGRTTRASGGAVVVVPTTTGRGERGVKVASVNADDALRAQLSGKQDPMAFVISSSVPETGEVLKFTSLLHNARDGRTYAAAFGDARRGAGEDDASKATNRRLDMEQREDDGGGSENDEDYDEDAEDGDEDDAAWFAKVDENFPLERYATLNPTLSDDEDDDEYYADNEAARPALDVGEAEARMKPRRGESGLENEEWERGVVWGADSDEDEEIRLAAVGIDTVGAFKKPRRDEETDLSSQVTVPSLPPATALASATSRSWGELDGESPSGGASSFDSAVSDYMRHLSLYGVVDEKQQSGDVDMTDANAARGAGEMLRMRNHDFANGRWLGDVEWEGKPRQVIDPHRKYILPKVQVNPNDPRLVLQYKGDLEATVWKWANAVMAPSWDLDPVNDIDEALNISMDDKYKEENEQTVDTGERPPRQGRIDGIQHAEFLLTSVPQLVRDPLNDYPAPRPMLRPPTVLPKHATASMKIKIAGSELQTFKVCIKSLNIHSAVINLKVRGTDTIGSVIPRIRKRWTDLDGPIHLYYPGSPKPNEKLNEEMTLVDAGLQAQVGLPIIYLVAPKVTFISEEAALAPLASDAVLAPPGAYKKPSDLSARSGTLMMVQYTEARPPLIAKPGMGAKKVVYYRRKTLGDQGARPYANATTTVIDLKPNAPSPFLAELPPGRGITALETSMFRAPLFQQAKSDDYVDFLLIRAPNGKLTLREAPSLHLAGQQEPHVEIPAPGSDMLKDFEERLVNATVLRYFLNLQAKGLIEPGTMPTVKSTDVAATLSHALSVRDVRKNIRRKICAVRRGAEANEDEYVLNPSYRFEHEKEVQRMATPEEVCAYESYRHAVAVLCKDRDRDEQERILRLSSLSLQQLKNAVTILIRHSEGKRKRQLENLELWLQIQPWAQTHEFLQASLGTKGILHLETSRRIQRLTGKFYNYIRRMTVPDPPEDRRPRREPGTVTGTNADLRKLTMPQAQRILENFGVEKEVILRLERWKRIGLIRELSGAATADGTNSHAGMARFARRLRVSEADQLKEIREHSDLLFKRQMKQYSQRHTRHEDSSSGGETDEDDSSSDSESESDSLADELEKQLEEKAAKDAPNEEDERAELEALRNALKDGSSIEPSVDPMKALAQGILVPGKKLKLKRVSTHIFPDGRSAKVEDDITEYAGEAWLQARAQGVEAADAATTAALIACGMDKPPEPPKEALERKELDDEETGLTPEARARYEMLRQRKRAKERVRRAGEKIKRLQSMGVTDEGADLANAQKSPGITPSERPAPVVPGPGGLKIKLGVSKKTMDKVFSSGATPQKKSTLGRKLPWDKVLIKVTESAMKHGTYGQVFTPAVTLSDYAKFVEQPMDLGAIMARLREGLYNDPSDWASDVKLIAVNAQAYHGSEEPVELRLDWVPGMAADMVNYIADQAKRHEADIKASFSDFSADSLRVARQGATAGGDSAPAEVKTEVPTEPAAPPKPLPKLKFSFGKKS
jgi:transcription initiation factor TFIID subunit 1